MNKFLILIIAVLLGIIAVLVAKDAYAPTEPRNGDGNQGTEIPDDIAEHIASKQDMIVLEDPGQLSVISSPVTVRGKARGGWYFEASFPIILVDWDGRIIAESFATAQLDPNDPESTWMTEEFVPFEGTLEFETPENIGDFSRRGAIILQKDNPSGLPEHDDALEIPIYFWE